MNVYDFDGTIYSGDSSVDFWLFCCKKHPRIIFFLPLQLYGIFMYKLGWFSKTQMKECFFSFLRQVPSAETMAQLFWFHFENKIEGWYLKQKDEEDVIISASPDFLLRPLCNKLKIKYLIASRVHPKTGYFESENCYGEEKVRRFKSVFPKSKMHAFYSDSESDNPMAKEAQQAYFCSKGRLCPWNLN